MPTFSFAPQHQRGERKPDPLEMVLGLYHEFGPESEAKTDVLKAQTAYYGRNEIPEALDKIRAETGEIQSRGKLYEDEGKHNKIQAHMLTAQMLQQMFPDQPNIGQGYLANAAETDPDLAAVKPILHRMIELPRAVGRIRAGQPQPGDEDLVGNVSPVTLATARAEGAKHFKTTTGPSAPTEPAFKLAPDSPVHKLGPMLSTAFDWLTSGPNPFSN